MENRFLDVFFIVGIEKHTNFATETKKQEYETNTFHRDHEYRLLRAG